MRTTERSVPSAFDLLSHSNVVAVVPYPPASAPSPASVAVPPIEPASGSDAVTVSLSAPSGAGRALTGIESSAGGLVTWGIDDLFETVEFADLVECLSDLAGPMNSETCCGEPIKPEQFPDGYIKGFGQPMESLDGDILLPVFQFLVILNLKTELAHSLLRQVPLHPQLLHP